MLHGGWREAGERLKRGWREAKERFTGFTIINIEMPQRVKS